MELQRIGLVVVRCKRVRSSCEAQLPRHSEEFEDAFIGKEHNGRVRNHTEQVRCHASVPASNAFPLEDEPKSAKDALVHGSSTGFSKARSDDFVGVGHASRDELRSRCYAQIFRYAQVCNTNLCVLAAKLGVSGMIRGQKGNKSETEIEGRARVVTFFRRTRTSASVELQGDFEALVEHELKRRLGNTNVGSRHSAVENTNAFLAVHRLDSVE